MKIQKIPTDIKVKAKTGNRVAIMSLLSVLKHNDLVKLSQIGEQKDFRFTQGHLQALEEIEELLS